LLNAPADIPAGKIPLVAALAAAPAYAAAPDEAASDTDWFSDASAASPAALTSVALVAASSPAPAPAATPAYHPSQVRPLDTVEREAVDYALRAFHGNVAKAARALKVNPSTLYRKIQVWTSAPGSAMEVAT
jgi:two-component system repressor protein LuxO